jgi:hypothetical protein
MTINGNGTISGLTAGGLPAGSVIPATTQVGASPSMVRLVTMNGAGSTNTAIRRFTTTVISQGTDITYADSATLGATFTVNANGVYAISYCDAFGSSQYVGLSLNSTQLSTSIDSINNADKLIYGDTAAANVISAVAWSGYLASSSVVRAHGIAGLSNSAVLNRCSFTITRVA